MQSGLLVFGALLIIGCSEGDILYPGAPTVSIKKISVDWLEPQIIGFDYRFWEGKQVQVPIYGVIGPWGMVQIHYSLEVQEPLPYDIEVKLLISGRSKTQNGWTGIIDDYRNHSIEAGRRVSGKKLILTEFDRFDQEKDALQGDERERIKNNLRFQTVEISIEPWPGIGSAAYNIGSPATLTVNR